MDTSSTFELKRGERLWRIDFSAMASPCEVLCETDDFDFARALAQFAAAEARRIDEKFSRYKAGSVVAAILESRGRSITVDDETARLLDYGEMLWRVSEGRFDLTSGILRHAWQFEEATHAPEPTRIPELMRCVGWQRLQWASPVLTLPAGMEIDFGGIGKEYAVDRVADFAARESGDPVLVNFGGDLRCTGAAPASGAWQVGIESLSQARPAREADRAEVRRARDQRRCTPRDRHRRPALRPHPRRPHRLAGGRRAALRHRRRADLLTGGQLLHPRHAPRRRRRGLPASGKPSLLGTSLT